MSPVPPTTKEIADNILAQLEASLNQSLSLLPKAFTRVLAKALAAVFVLIYKYAGFMFLQIFVRTASMATTEVNGVSLVPLIEWGRLIGVGDPTAATQAELLIEITVTNQTGVLPVSSQLLGATNGVTYVTLTAVTLDASTKQVAVRAVSDQSGGDGSGAIGNLPAASTVSFANPLANVARAAVVVSASVTGSDAESPENYRQRVLDRFQKRPQGGAYADYEVWGEEAAGILNVYPYASECPGQVDVYVEATPESSGSPDGIPTTPQLNAVLQLIESDSAGLATRRPVGALVNAFPINRLGFTVTVFALTVSDPAQTQADIETALTEYFLAREPFIVGLSVPPRLDRITRTAVDGTIEDIVSAAGGVFGGSSVTQSGTLVEAYTLGIGEKAKLLSVAFT